MRYSWFHWYRHDDLSDAAIFTPHLFIYHAAFHAPPRLPTTFRWFWSRWWHDGCFHVYFSSLRFIFHFHFRRWHYSYIFSPPSARWSATTRSAWSRYARRYEKRDTRALWFSFSCRCFRLPSCFSVTIRAGDIRIEWRRRHFHDAIVTPTRRRYHIWWLIFIMILIIAGLTDFSFSRRRRFIIDFIFKNIKFPSLTEETTMTLFPLTPSSSSIRRRLPPRRRFRRRLHVVDAQTFSPHRWLFHHATTTTKDHHCHEDDEDAFRCRAWLLLLIFCRQPAPAALSRHLLLLFHALYAACALIFIIIDYAIITLYLPLFFIFHFHAVMPILFIVIYRHFLIYFSRHFSRHAITITPIDFRFRFSAFFRNK